MTDANGKASWLNDLKYYACSRDTVRSDVLWVMTEAGVPAIYRPHSTRAASGAAIRRGGGTERNADLSSDLSTGFTTRSRSWTTTATRSLAHCCQRRVRSTIARCETATAASRSGGG